MHESANSEHEPPLLKLPPAPLSLQMIVPVGVVEAPESISVTVTVKLIVMPLIVEEGLGATAVLVVRVLTVKRTGLEDTVLGMLSVTWSSKDQDPTVDRMPVETVGVSPRLQENELPRLL